MIERYINCVTSKLPESSREEIGEQVRDLINQTKKEINEEISEEEKVYKALEKLGDPDLLADKYRMKKRYLIGPNYIDNYIYVMKIVLISILIGVSISSGIGVIFSGDGIVEVIVEYIATLLSILIQGAAWVTGIFAFLEYKEIPAMILSESEKWKPSKLPQLINKKSLISKGESIFNIIISSIFFSLFYFGPQYLAIYYKKESNLNVINIFNLDVLKSFNIMIIIIFALTIINEIIKILIGRWNLKLAITNSVIDIISSILAIKIISNDFIWNNEIIKLLEKQGNISFNRVILITIFIIVIITISEVAMSLYKGFKYKN